MEALTGARLSMTHPACADPAGPRAAYHCVQRASLGFFRFEP